MKPSPSSRHANARLAGGQRETGHEATAGRDARRIAGVEQLDRGAGWATRHARATGAGRVRPAVSDRRRGTCAAATAPPTWCHCNPRSRFRQPARSICRQPSRRMGASAGVRIPEVRLLPSRHGHGLFSRRRASTEMAIGGSTSRRRLGCCTPTSGCRPWITWTWPS